MTGETPELARDINLNEVLQQVASVTGSPVAGHSTMSVGFGLSGFRMTLADGRDVAVKAGQTRRPGQLALEGAMLRDLSRQSELPVPEVWHADDTLLVMGWIDNDGGAPVAAAQKHAAELLTALHARTFELFGYDHDTVIGPLAQPNPQGSRWIDFFRDHRLLHMAAKAYERGALPAELRVRLETLAGRLDSLLLEPAHPSLIHGDVWGGNVLVKGSRIAGFIDPALSWSHPEIELAFTTLFATFSQPFFDAYEAIAGIEPGFHETRKDIYNLYPLLVHVRLFGGGYLAPIDTTLRRLGI